jgi:hypothetical protein
MTKGEVMRKAILILSILCLAASTAISSTLVVTTDNHGVPRGANGLPIYVVFLGERLIANVKLDVFVVPMPSSRVGYDKLSKLTQTTWIDALHWSLVAADGRHVALPFPALLRNTVRHRGPNAARVADRDRLVEVTSFEARLDFGFVPAGDYTLRVSIDGLQSSYPVASRTGDEPEARDAYLEMRASRASTFGEFRDIQLERYRNDPTNSEPVFLALDRALSEGSIDDARRLLALGIQEIDMRRVAEKDPKKVQFFEARLRELRRVEAVMPEYFGRRGEWRMSRDFAEGGYVIRDRRNRTIVRRFGEPAAMDYLRSVRALEN